MNKDLTLDLLAIGIDTLQRTYDRIKQEPDSASPWPQVESLQAAPGPVEQQSPQPQPQPETSETSETSTEPEAQDNALLHEAQTILRHISLTEGPAWITGELFPHFGVKTLTDVPKDKLQELIDMATKHKETMDE
ncbi:hypothetical protein [Corynebacterium hiratae]|uniref:Uncharacterized protein n=1 Tax=Corynebacterium aurimucosum TaxID=169292 RepID=A0A6I3K9A2_9CORY|nr:hypothetical protein [Corynebacterium aurimucosum]MTD91138.1 hypothetical protein [Corynebacterium aurimucosum]